MKFVQSVKLYLKSGSYSVYKIVESAKTQITYLIPFLIVNCPAANDSLPVADLPKDLSTIDMKAFASLSNEVAACPSTPATPATPALQATPATPVTSAALVESTVASLPLSVPVSEDVIRSCVTPRKVLIIQKALEKETQRHKCALKLVPYFFTQEELTKSNPDGSHGKERLDSTKLNSLKVIVFSKFPLDCPLEKEKIWKNVKSRINSKCRATKFAFTTREF